MKVLSLFSGVGGFDMGLENAGMETVFQCEWDKHANSILHKHWPGVPKWDDVSTLTGKHILAHAPIVDVVAWGSPCQDLSVAGKRGGLQLDGGRSNLFHEGIRIIKELRKETHGQYPRISIWENVVGALNSNRGADFGIIINEMAEAGAVAIEWSVLDAQYFGIPQRRRRVFVIAIFDPVLANRCPNPLLPISESLPGHPAKSKPKRQSAATTLTESTGTDGGIVNAIGASLYHHGSVVNQDANAGHMVVEQEVVGTLTVSDLVKQVTNHIIGKGLLRVFEDRQPYTVASFAQYKEEDLNAVATLRAGGGDLGGGSEVLIGEPAIVFNDDRRIGPTIHGDTVSTLQAFMGSGGNNTPMVAQETEPPIIVEPATVFKQSGFGQFKEEVDAVSTLLAKGGSMGGGSEVLIGEPILIDGTRVDDVRVYESPVQTLKERMGTGGNNVPMLAYDTQFESNANVTEDVAPTIKASQRSPSVAYPIDTRNALRNPEKYDAQNRQGLGIGADGDPMATLTPAHVNAVAYDEYNDTTNDVHHALRAGTKQSTGVLMFQDSEFGVKEYDTAGTLRAGRPAHQMIGEVAATLRSGGDGGVPSSRGEHLVAEPTMAVRRLTPLECERLMGWPDDHTRYKADGTEQADTHRYKQCGNGVASPVAQWIAKHILNI